MNNLTGLYYVFHYLRLVLVIKNVKMAWTDRICGLSFTRWTTKCLFWNVWTKIPFYSGRSSGSRPFTPSSFAKPRTILILLCVLAVVLMVKRSRKGGETKGSTPKPARATRASVEDGKVAAPAVFDKGWSHLKVSVCIDESMYVARCFGSLLLRTSTTRPDS